MVKVKARQYRYNRSDKGRAVFLASAYKRIDAAKGLECEMDQRFLLDNIFSRPCVYCGDDQSPIGCDRIDNRRGHTRDNVVPACATCNFARGDRLTHDEMLKVGKLIAQIMRDRQPT